MTPDGPPPLRILIVEDDADCGESLALVLRFYGYAVEIASSGLEALAVAETGRPDVALVDIGLPGMDGYELAGHLRRPRPLKSPLLIAVTGYGQDKDRRRSAAAGFDLHLVKPIAPDELRVILEKFRGVGADQPRPE